MSNNFFNNNQFRDKKYYDVDEYNNEHNIYNGVTKDQIKDENIKKLFNIFDKDNDGRIENCNDNGVDEVYSLLQAIEHNKNNKNIKYSGKTAIVEINNLNKIAISTEFFVNKILQLDLSTNEGANVYSALEKLSQNDLNKVVNNYIKYNPYYAVGLKGMNIVDAFKLLGLKVSQTLKMINKNTTPTKTQAEILKEQREQELGIDTMNFAKDVLIFIYENAANMLENYEQNIGLFDGGAIIEGYSDIVDLITPDSIYMSNKHLISEYRSIAKQLKKLKSIRKDFPKKFQEITGQPYDAESLDQLKKIIVLDKVNINSEEFKDACYKAFGFRGLENIENLFDNQQWANGAIDIAMMLTILGEVGKGPMVVDASSKTFATFKKLLTKASDALVKKSAKVGKVATKSGKTATKSAQGVAKLGENSTKLSRIDKVSRTATGIVMGGTQLGGYTLVKESINNLTAVARDATDMNTWTQTLQASLESAGFGAFGGLFTPLVVNKVIMGTQKLCGTSFAQKGFSIIGRALKATSKMTGKDVMMFMMKAQEAGLFPKMAGFLTEVVGFTGYEVAIDIIKDICDDNGNLPEDMTLENLCKYIYEKAKGQFKSLGEIKTIGHLIMMRKGGRSAQYLAYEGILNNCKNLSKTEIMKINTSEGEILQIKNAKGEKFLAKNIEDVVSYCGITMQFDLVYNEHKLKQPNDVKNNSHTEEVVSQKKVVVSKPEEKLETKPKEEVKPKKTYVAPKVEEISDKDLENKLIKRYEELSNKKNKTSQENNELLSLTFELTEKGYAFKDGHLDFTYNRNQKTLPNSTKSKSEFLQELKKLNLSDRTIENIGYNINKINLELLDVLKQYPEMLNSSFGVAILCDIKPENVPNKIKIINQLGTNSILSSESKVTLISRTNMNNLEQINSQIDNITQNLNFLRESGMQPELLTKYEKLQVDVGLTFSKELFNIIKNSELKQSDLCFVVDVKDIPAMEMMFKQLEKNSDISTSDKVNIIRNIKAKDIDKIDLVELLKDKKIKGLSLIDIYKNLADINVENLKLLSKIEGFKEQYFDVDLKTIKPEDLLAKIEINKLLEQTKTIDNQIAQRLYSITTHENLDSVKNRVSDLDCIYSDNHILPHIKADYIKLILAGKLDSKETREIFDSIKNDYKLLNLISNENKFDIFDGVDEANSKTFKSFYQEFKNYDIDIKLFILDNYKSGIDKNELQDLLNYKSKIAKYNEIKEPTFTPEELKKREIYLKEVNRIINYDFSYQNKNVKEDLKKLFAEAKTMEELEAKIDILNEISKNGNYIFSELDIVGSIKIKEHADVMRSILKEGDRSDTSITANMYFLSIYFDQQYSVCKKFGKNMIGAGRYYDNNRNLTNIRSLYYVDFSKLKNAEIFDRFKTLWNDKKIFDSSKMMDIASDIDKYNEYKKLVSSPLYKNINSSNMSEIIDLISSGEKFDVKDIQNVEILIVKSAIKSYQTKTNIVSNPEKVNEQVNNLSKTINNFNEQKFRSYHEQTLEIINQVISENTDLNRIELEKILNSDIDFSNVYKRSAIIKKCSPKVALKLTFCSDKDFNQIINIIEQRPEILTQKFSLSSFLKMINMSDAEWNNFKTDIKDKKPTEFDANEYEEKLDARLKENFVLDMSVFDGIERKRALENNSDLGRFTKVIPFEPKSTMPVTTEPNIQKGNASLSFENLWSKLESSGQLSIEFKDNGGLNPTKEDLADIKSKDLDKLNKMDGTGIVLNIGEARAWENSRLVRDLLQNFYDGNGHTLEGVNIEISKTSSGKYAVKITGKGIYDYDRLLDFGYGTKAEDDLSAGQHGEGSKIIYGNLLYSKGADVVKYSSGKWTLELSAEKDKKPSESEILKNLHENEQFKDGNSLEFETNNAEFIQELIKSRNYFFSPENKDFKNLDYENDYMGIKILPKGQKGNIYVIQRYEVEGQKGLGGTLDGMTLIFKTRPNAKKLTELSHGKELKLDTGRDRVPLSKSKITELVTQYARTMSNEDLINIIGQMKDNYTYRNVDDNNHNEYVNQNLYIIQGFIKVAAERHLKIDFGHNDFIAIKSREDIEQVIMYGKIPVVSEMKQLGIRTFDEYHKEVTNSRRPITNLTEVQKQKLKILEEAMLMFSSYLDINNCDVITETEAKAPKYVYRPTENDNVEASAIVDMEKHIYSGHWVLERYLETGNFYDCLATWLHETSHKINGDGTSEFNTRLTDIEKLIVNINNSDPSFAKKLSILAKKYETLNNPALVDGRTDALDIYKRKMAQKSNGLNNSTLGEKDASAQDIEVQVMEHALARRLKSIAEEIETPVSVVEEPKVTTPSATLAKYSRYKLKEHNESNLTEFQDYKKALENNGTLHIDLPITEDVKVSKGDTKISKSVDREHLGETVNSPIMMNYNSAQEWTYDMVARDILQNFYDGHGGTLDGVKIDIDNVNGKYKVKISGLSEYSYLYLKNMYSSSHENDSEQAGGFGEGSKMVAKTLLADHTVDKLTFASGEWSMDFVRESGIAEKDMHLARVLRENTDKRVNGNYLEFETASSDFIESLLKAKNFFKNSSNQDFKNLDYENEYFGFKILRPNEYGNLYYNQRYAVKDDGNLEGALKGISIIFKQEVPKEIREGLGWHKDCDRKGMTSLEIEHATSYIASKLTDQELLGIIKKLDSLWLITKLDQINISYRSKLSSPEDAFLKGLVKEAAKRELTLDTGDAKMASIYDFGNERKDIIELKEKGYEFVSSSLEPLGVKSVYYHINSLREVVPIQVTKIEKQKLAILQELMPECMFEIFDEPSQEPVKRQDSGTISISRDYLKNANFNTLYADIKVQQRYSYQKQEWGYNITNLLADELRMTQDPIFQAKYKVAEKYYNQLK